MAQSLVFNIQRYSLHDGQGIRTLIFLKGCPLSCRWCCNPESQSFLREVSFVAQDCLGQDECGWCTARIPSSVRFQDGSKPQVDRAVCISNPDVVTACPSHALRFEGDAMSVDELLDVIMRDEPFFTHGGGVTVSGGEPLAHQPFLSELLDKARSRRINTAIETCGYAPYSSLTSVADVLDEIFYDIKCLDSELHRLWTGHTNYRILDNFRRLCEDFPDLHKIVRTPVVPGFNDTQQEISSIITFLTDIPNVSYQLLPYHSFGRSKYDALGRHYLLGDAKLDLASFAALEHLVDESPLVTREKLEQTL